MAAPSFDTHSFDTTRLGPAPPPPSTSSVREVAGGGGPPLPAALEGAPLPVTTPSSESVARALSASRTPSTLKAMGTWIKENPTLFTGIALASAGAIITTACLASGVGAPGAIIGITLIGIGAVLMVKSTEWDAKFQTRPSDTHSGPSFRPLPSSTALPASSLGSSSSPSPSSSSSSSTSSSVPPMTATAHPAPPPSSSSRRGASSAPPPPTTRATPTSSSSSSPESSAPSSSSAASPPLLPDRDGGSSSVSSLRLSSLSSRASYIEDNDEDKEWDRAKLRTAAESSDSLSSSYAEENVTYYHSWDREGADRLVQEMRQTKADVHDRRIGARFTDWMLRGITRVFG